MKNWMRRIRGAVGMGLTWALVGFLAGIGIELMHNLWPNPLGSAGLSLPRVAAERDLLGDAT
jgi:hypothetical protein